MTKLQLPLETHARKNGPEVTAFRSMRRFGKVLGTIENENKIEC